MPHDYFWQWHTWWVFPMFMPIFWIVIIGLCLYFIFGRRGAPKPWEPGRRPEKGLDACRNRRARAGPGFPGDAPIHRVEGIHDDLIGRIPAGAVAVEIHLDLDRAGRRVLDAPPGRIARVAACGVRPGVRRVEGVVGGHAHLHGHHFQGRPCVLAGRDLAVDARGGALARPDRHVHGAEDRHPHGDGDDAFDERKPPVAFSLPHHCRYVSCRVTVSDSAMPRVFPGQVTRTSTRQALVASDETVVATV